MALKFLWHSIDVGADPRPLGRIASQIAICLMGKHKPIYDPSTDCGDYVVVAGCSDLQMNVTGKKFIQKTKELKSRPVMRNSSVLFASLLPAAPANTMAGMKCSAAPSGCANRAPRYVIMTSS